ncbi:MAG TPA: hypothetical protein VN969_10250 [Streptosporangiaceae bacterium]|nr:hypothetical protein [Streptosporangiaceae bacterium]
MLGPLERLGVLHVLLECRGGALEVAGGQQIQQQSSDDCHGEAGLRPGGALVQPRSGQCLSHRGDRRLDVRLEEAFRARAAEQRVRVQLEEQPFLRPQLRVAEVLPGITGAIGREHPVGQPGALGLLNRAGDRLQ